MATCWACGQDNGNGAFCAACGKIQPGRPRDFFELMGLERRYHLDVPALERSYRELSRRLHPDKFARAEARERRFSLEQTTQLNQALKTLRDPTARAEYLLKQHGYTVASEEAGRSGAGERLPLEFYEQVIEDREALVEAKAEGPDAVRRLADGVTRRRDETLARADGAFTEWERTGDAQVLAPAVTELAKLRYYARFLDEVEGRPHD